jgi:hypothetical protein
MPADRWQKLRQRRRFKIRQSREAAPDIVDRVVA